MTKERVRIGTGFRVYAQPEKMEKLLISQVPLDKDIT